MVLKHRVICLNILSFLQDWESRENLSSICRFIYETCCLEQLNVPTLTVTMCSPKPIIAFQSLAARSMTLTTIQDNPSTVSIKGIRKLVSYLASTHYRLQLLVPEYNFVTFHRRLTAAKTDHKIVLLAVSTSKDTSSSFDGGQPGLIRKDYDDYEIPVQVERSLRAVKRTLMKLYIDSGQAKLKRQRISNPSYIDILIKRNIVNKSCVY